MKKPVTIIVDEDLWNSFKSECAKRDQKISEVIEQILKKRLDEK